MSRSPATWSLLRQVDRAMVAGLVVEHGSRGRSMISRTPYGYEGMEYWETHLGIVRGLSAAAAGLRPEQLVDEVPSWVPRVLRQRMTHDARHLRGDFTAARLLELTGLVSQELDATYVLAMLSGLPDPLGWVRDDPALIEAFWQIFEVTPTPEVGIDTVDAVAPAGRWRRAIVTLTTEGAMPRPRVLDACLAALDRDGDRWDWFVRLLTALAPTDAELWQRQQQLIALLHRPAPNTVALALGHLKALSLAGALDTVSTAPALVAVTASPSSDLALAALDLLDTIAARDPHADVLPALRMAIAHRDDTVHHRAVDQLRWLAGHSAGRPTGTATSPAFAMSRIPVPRQPRPRALVEVVADLLDEATDPLLIEQTLAGLAGAPDRSALDALQVKAATMLARAKAQGTSSSLPAQLAGLVVSCIGRTVELPAPQATSHAFLRARVDEVAAMLTAGEPPRQLLATPDDGVWIHPATLVERINRLTRRPLTHDLIAALLRLGPHGREDALRQVRAAGEVGAVLRHALGAPGADPEQVRASSWWVAASRARAPFDPDPVLIEAGLGGSGQGRPLDVRLRVDALDRQEHDILDTRAARWSARILTGYPAWVRHRSADRSRMVRQPTATAGAPRAAVSHTADPGGYWFAWSATIWPHDADHFLVDGLPTLVHSAWRNSLPMSGDDTHLLAGLADHPGRWGELATAALAVGLAVYRSQDRARATDLLLDAVTAGRITPDALAAAMAAAVGPCTPRRWSSSLRDLGTRGIRPFVIETLTRLIPQLSPDEPGLHDLLERLQEEQVALAVQVHDPVLLEFLDALSRRGGKAGRAAQPLLTGC